MYPGPPADAFTSGTNAGAQEGGGVPIPRQRSGPFQALVKAKADPKKLCRLLAYVRVGAALEAGRRPKEGTRKAQLRRAKEARLKRTPRRLREFADEIERDLFSNPEFDPRRLLPPSENKMCLKEAIAKAEKYSDVRALV